MDSKMKHAKGKTDGLEYPSVSMYSEDSVVYFKGSDNHGGNGTHGKGTPPRGLFLSCLAGLLLTLGLTAPGKDIQFGGYAWNVRSGRGGPGPNAWEENNVWLD